MLSEGMIHLPVQTAGILMVDSMSWIRRKSVSGNMTVSPGNFSPSSPKTSIRNISAPMLKTSTVYKLSTASFLFLGDISPFCGVTDTHFGGPRYTLDLRASSPVHDELFTFTSECDTCRPIVLATSRNYKLKWERTTVKLSQILNKGTLLCVNGDVKVKNDIFINITGRFVRHVTEFTGRRPFKRVVVKQRFYCSSGRLFS